MLVSQCSNHFDDSLLRIPGLKGLPWIGENFPALPIEQRVIIIGESHYANETSGDQYQGQCHTRLMVHQTFLTRQWTTKTLTGINHLLFPQQNYPRARFWADAVYYNFVQRIMGNLSERPSGEDFVQGWATCLGLIQLLKPSHCLFIGVSAANHFDWSLEQLNAEFGRVQITGKVGRTHGRTASIFLDTHTVNLHFVKHSGKYFSAPKWNTHLQQHAPSMMRLMDNPIYRSPTIQAA